MRDRLPIIIALALGLLGGHFFLKSDVEIGGKEKPASGRLTAEQIDAIAPLDSGPLPLLSAQPLETAPLNLTRFEPDTDTDIRKNLQLTEKLDLKKELQLTNKVNVKKDLQLTNKLKLDKKFTADTKLDLTNKVDPSLELELEKKLQLQKEFRPARSDVTQ